MPQRFGRWLWSSFFKQIFLTRNDQWAVEVSNDAVARHFSCFMETHRTHLDLTQFHCDPTPCRGSQGNALVNEGGTSTKEQEREGKRQDEITSFFVLVTIFLPDLSPISREEVVGKYIQIYRVSIESHNDCVEKFYRVLPKSLTFEIVARDFRCTETCRFHLEILCLVVSYRSFQVFRKISPLR